MNAMADSFEITNIKQIMTFRFHKSGVFELVPFTAALKDPRSGKVFLIPLKPNLTFVKTFPKS